MSFVGRFVLFRSVLYWRFHCRSGIATTCTDYNNTPHCMLAFIVWPWEINIDTWPVPHHSSDLCVMIQE